MLENGYWIKRRSNHLIWTNGVHQIVTAVSPSDWRAILNIESEVKRKTVHRQHYKPVKATAASTATTS